MPEYDYFGTIYAKKEAEDKVKTELYEEVGKVYEKINNK